jgi:hypothetical protein
MYLDEDMGRIRAALTARMRRGWLEGDPDSITIRPLARWRRHYLVQFSDGKVRRQWRVDGSSHGVVLMPTGDGVTAGAERQDVLVSNIRRILKSRLPSLTVRRELAKLRQCAGVEGFDFPTLYELAARQLSWMPEDAASLLAELAETPYMPAPARAA